MRRGLFFLFCPIMYIIIPSIMMLCYNDKQMQIMRRGFGTSFKCTGYDYETFVEAGP